MSENSVLVLKIDEITVSSETRERGIIHEHDECQIVISVITVLARYLDLIEVFK